MGGAFVLINKDSALVAPATADWGKLFNKTGDNALHCQAYKNCDFCVTDER
jgi:hypothetical protein